MAAKKRRFVIGPGTAVFPALVRPDTKFDEDGVYKVDLRLDPNAPVREQTSRGKLGDPQPIKEWLDKLWSMAAAMAKKEGTNAKQKKPATEPYVVEEEDDEPTGFIIVKLASKATWKDKKTGQMRERELPLFDAQGKRFYPDSMWSGSELKVNFTPDFYVSSFGYGVKLYLNSVQVLSLVEAGDDGSGFGFGVEDEYVDETGAEDADEDEDADGGDVDPDF